MRWWFSLALLALLSSPSAGAGGLTSAEQIAASCQFSNVSFVADFPMARLDGCEQKGSNSYLLHLKPERTPINPSPWYAFRVVNHTEQVQPLQITLQSHGANARYAPRISIDKQQWLAVPHSKQETRMQIALELQQQPLYVAGAEIIDNDFYQRWLNDLDQGTVSSLGQTSQGRDIPALEHRAEGSDDWLILIGRQHPPEISGALGLLHFNNLLWSDDTEMVAFRARYNILLVPNMNPDGVHHGNWRHSMGGVDLNRDWRSREQPETQALHAKLQAIQAAGGRIRFALDFHSTWRNVYYTMSDDYVTALGTPIAPSQLVNDWLQALAAVIPFEVENKPSANVTSGVFKQYIADNYGVHAVTYEVGDSTDRAEIKATAEAALRTLIKAL